jgi:hypothetical protein
MYLTWLKKSSLSGSSDLLPLVVAQEKEKAMMRVEAKKG